MNLLQIPDSLKIIYIAAGYVGKCIERLTKSRKKQPESVFRAFRLLFMRMVGAYGVFGGISKRGMTTTHLSSSLGILA